MKIRPLMIKLYVYINHLEYLHKLWYVAVLYKRQILSYRDRAQSHAFKQASMWLEAHVIRLAF